MQRLVGVVLFLLLVSPAEAGVVALHQGSADPTTEGWIVEPGDPAAPPGVSEGPALDPLPWSSLVSAWSIYDDSTAGGSLRRYRVSPSAGDISDGQTLGWTYAVQLRVVDAPDATDLSVLFEYGNGTRRWIVGFGADASGHLLATLVGGPAVPVPAALTSSAGTSYHEVALAYVPSSNAADLYVDGVRLATGYAGVAAALTRIHFGSGDSSGTGRGHYASVRFDTGLQACRDGIDNDGDGLVDLLDGGCEAASDPSEQDPLAPCDDGADDDADALVDAADPECQATGGASERRVLPLAWNWNGMLHHGETGAPSASGYRSISDRGIDLRLPGSAGLPPFTTTGPSGLVYELAGAARTWDLVHLGNRNTVDGGSKPLGSLPVWLSDPDQTGPQTSLFEPLPLGPSDAIGILYHASNGGGRFAVTLGFASGDPVEVIVHAPDWFAPFDPVPDAPTAGVAHQSRAAVMTAVGGVDNPAPGPDLALHEAVISVAELLRDGVADIAGRELVSLSFSDRFNPNSGYAIYAAAYGAGTPLPAPQSHLMLPVKIDDAHVVGSSPPDAQRDEGHLVDGSGLALVDGTWLVTDNIPDGSDWSTAAPVAAVTFDLGSEQSIDFIQIWNFNDGAGNHDIGATSIDLQVSSVGTNAGDADFSSSPVLATLPIAEATGSTAYPGEGYRFNGMALSQVPPVLGGVQHDFSGVPVHGRFVRLSEIDGSIPLGRAGLSEVRFYRFAPPAHVHAALPVAPDHAHVLGDSLAETGRDEVQLVDGSGLELVGEALLVTTGQPNGNNWNTTTPVAAVTFDLGSEQRIDFIQIWNFNDSFGNNDFGATSIDLQVSSVGTDAGNADFSVSPVIATLPIAEATGSTAYTGEGYRFNGHTSPTLVPRMLTGVQHDFSGLSLQGRFVRLSEIDGSLSFGGRAGLSEVRFYRYLPEPGAGSGLCAGAALLAVLARRQARR